VNKNLLIRNHVECDKQRFGGFILSGKIVAITLNPSIDKTIAIDHLVPYGLNRVKNYRLDPGGKGINVARVLKNFGANVIVSGLNAGENGKLLMKFLEKARIDSDFLQIEGETRTNLKIFDESVNKMTEINESGFFIDSEIQASFKMKFQSLMRETDIVVLCGSLPPGVPLDFYAECIEIAKKQGVKTLLDADGEALQKGLGAIPYAVKPNIHELEMLIGRKCTNNDDVIQAAKKLINKGVEIVIVSMGSDGAIVADKNEVFKVDSWNIPVKSTVGAGDSMVGALAYSVQREASLFDIAKITTAAGTITASKAGTEICGLDETLGSLANVIVHKI
jgi:1-phosphofructokinase